MRAFKTIREKDVLAYACKGICEAIVRAPMEDLDRLNEQFSEMHERRKAIRTEEAEAPFECD